MKPCPSVATRRKLVLRTGSAMLVATTVLAGTDAGGGLTGNTDTDANIGTASRRWRTSTT